MQPNERHLACMAKLKAALDPELSAVEMLAIVSQLVGNLIALQDQKAITPDMALTIVSKNMEIGNAAAIERVASAGGKAN